MPRSRRNEPDPAERLVALGLGGGRIAIGVGLWAAPRLTLRALGFQPMDGGALAVARIAGSRDIALGVLVLAGMGDRRALRRPVAAATACDAGDALAFTVLAAERETTSVPGSGGPRRPAPRPSPASGFTIG